ncbi:flotillin family protein [Streptomyces kebangsaanensis]|uniref:hypothetical protein n=1 Tax=Streptomyces kebangsaanensis TaxID=864058 RepID=UPI000940118C|nr:hypothetical protein [Streptomyces kebangsaanensis]
MSTETPEQVLADADAIVRQADATLQQLEARVIADDDTVTPADIEQARGHRYWAGLQRKRAESRAARLRAEEAERRRTTALAEAERLLAEHPQEAIDARMQDVRTAVAALRAEVDAYNENASAAFRVMSNGNAVPALPVRSGTPFPRVPGLSWAYFNGAPMLWRDGENILRRDTEWLVRQSVQQPTEG